MVTVSVNAYNDADLLDNCLASIRDHLPDVQIMVVDGRYETFRPDASDNSQDDTPAVAAKHNAEYYPDGPYRNERAKHLHRIRLAPKGERLLFIDADERLLQFDADAIPDDRAGRVRIHNALMYGEGDVTYYPRWFYPSQMESIQRVDAFRFDCGVDKTDAITFTHRADLRDDQYRDEKLNRFEREDREPWYQKYLDTLRKQGHAAEFEECPNCGRESVTRSRVCGYDESYSTVVTCTAGDQCYAAVEPMEWDGEYRYLPDRVSEGFAEDRERIRLELMHAGNAVARTLSPRRLERYEPNARIWVREHFSEDTNA